LSDFSCFEDIAFQVLDLHVRLLIKPTCFATSLVYSGIMETKKCPVLVVDHPCGLELFLVSTEEPTSDSPSPEKPQALSDVFLSGGFLLPGCIRQWTDRKRESGSLSHRGFLQSSPAAPHPL
jgi:hypothetical protein